MMRAQSHSLPSWICKAVSTRETGRATTCCCSTLSTHVCILLACSLSYSSSTTNPTLSRVPSRRDFLFIRPCHRSTATIHLGLFPTGSCLAFRHRRADRALSYCQTGCQTVEPLSLCGQNPKDNKVPGYPRLLRFVTCADSFVCKMVWGMCRIQPSSAQVLRNLHYREISRVDRDHKQGAYDHKGPTIEPCGGAIDTGIVNSL